MKKLATSILEACFLNCSCMSTSVIEEKLNQLTHNSYLIECVESDKNHIIFKFDDVLVTFHVNARNIVDKIWCEEIKIAA